MADFASKLKTHNKAVEQALETDSSFSPNIAACLMETQGMVVDLDAKNTGGGNYKYASLQHLQSAVMPFIKKHNLILRQSVVEKTTRSGMVKIQKKSSEPPLDKLMSFASCTVVTQLLDPATGLTYEVTTFGDKVDQSSDKTLGAFTVARRYGIATLFGLILTEDDGADPDGDSDVLSQLTGGGSKQTKQSSGNVSLASILSASKG